MASINDRLTEAIELQGKGQLEDAAQRFHAILADEPANGAALYSLAVIALNGGKPADALALTTAGIAAAPGFPGMWLAHGSALQGLGRLDEALASMDQALQLDPDFTDALVNSGALLRSLLRHKEALERFNQVLVKHPEHTTALANCAILLTEFKESRHAIAMFERLLALKPDYDYGLGLLAYERLHICDWTDFETLHQRIVDGVLAGQRTCKTLALMALTDDAAAHHAAALTFARHWCPRAPRQLWLGERYRHDRIRVAYLSPDLREHPVAHLMTGVFEHHDRARFETIAISLGIDDGSRLRERIVKVFDHFIDVRGMGSPQVAERIRALEADIVVDLAGYTSDSRLDILSWRPAPVQATFLGYPGTLGTDYVDWLIADRHIVPAGHERFFTEKIARLPDAYLPTDASLEIAERTPTRAECGLPEEGFVFCSFSHDYKLNPPLFDCWMRLLHAVPGSVLWLVSRNPLSQENLKREAAARGVDPSRLVFASRVPRVEDHLARYRQADLFLDTHPYNAHTTAADALMAGLPVVTYMGDAFPSRVAGSLLHAAGMPELVAQSLAGYEALALELAQTPTRLRALRERLLRTRMATPLFDTKAFCRHLEAVYVAMWRKAQLGEDRDDL